MWRFDFNVLDGTQPIDEIGTELPDRPAARLAAVQLAGEILKDDPTCVALGDDWRIEVMDEAGLVLFQLRLVLVETPALLRPDF